MNKISILLPSMAVLRSCLPIRITPHIENYRVTKEKEFKRSLPKREVFVFENPKAANEF